MGKRKSIVSGKKFSTYNTMYKGADNNVASKRYIKKL